jgi:hypothetical protein
MNNRADNLIDATILKDRGGYFSTLTITEIPNIMGPSNPRT